MRCLRSRFRFADSPGLSRHDAATTRQRRGLALLCLICLPLAAQASELDVRLAYARADGDSWLVTTRVDIELDDEAERLLRAGLRLRVEVEFAVARPRPVLPDSQLTLVVRTVYLEFDREAERFVVSSPSADARAEFATMFSALRKIGYVADQPLVGQDELQPGEPHIFSVQARLFPDESGWWSRNVTGRLGFGLFLRSQTYTWSVTP
ncbi:MAG: DUF4390 domain-containing protein [Chromatiales bacterium]|nr:DUF4390 domain-containing protein [Chromatiales bacterium]